MQFASVILFLMAISAATAGGYYYGDNLDTKPVNANLKTVGMVGMGVAAVLALFAVFQGMSQSQYY